MVIFNLFFLYIVYFTFETLLKSHILIYYVIILYIILQIILISANIKTKNKKQISLSIIYLILISTTFWGFNINTILMYDTINLFYYYAYKCLIYL